MNRINNVLKIIFISFLSTFIFINKSLAEEENYEYINFEQLLEIKDNPEALAEVKTLTIVDWHKDKYDQILDNIHLIELLPNVENIEITANSLHLDKDFFESIKTSKKFTLSLSNGSVDFSDAHNDNLENLSLSENKVYNFEDVVNFSDLKSLSTANVDGFKVIDFRQTGLKRMEIRAQKIENYEDFFDKTSKIEELSLEQSNITNSDMKYIKKLSNLTSLSLVGTYVTDISFLESIPALENLSLPYYTDDFDVLYKLPNLKGVWFDSLSEVNIAKEQELLNYFNQNGILYTTFDSDIVNKFNNIITSLSVLETDTDLEKIEKVKNFVLDYMHIDDNYYETPYHTIIDRIINYRRGVCQDYSIFTYTLLKSVGVDAYIVNGSAKNLFEGGEDDYDMPGFHAWNVVHVGDNWYGMDVTWMETDDDLEMREIQERAFYLKNTYFDYDSDVYPYYHNQEEHDERYFALSHVAQNNPMDTINQEFKLTYIFPENEENNCDFKYVYAKEGTKWDNLCEPSKAGYNFIGWYSSSDQSIITENTVATQDEGVTPLWEAIIPQISQDSGFIVSNNYLKKMPLSIEVNDIDLKIDSVYETKVVNKDDQEKTDGLLATGDKIQIYLDGAKISEYKVIIMGDVNGTGTVTYADVTRVFNHKRKSGHPELITASLLEGEYFIAGDMNGNGEITYADVVQVFKKVRELKTHTN